MFRNPLIDAIVVLVALLLIFGPKRLPMLGRGIGHGMREFKDGITGQSSFSEEADEQPVLVETAATPVATAPAGEPAEAPRS
jgi:sec-independent protein translocase protein TatA